MLSDGCRGPRLTRRRGPRDRSTGQPGWPPWKSFTYTYWVACTETPAWPVLLPVKAPVITTGVSLAVILMVPLKETCAALVPPSGTSPVKLAPKPSWSPGTVTMPWSGSLGAGPPPLCQNCAVPESFQVPLSRTSVTSGVLPAAETATTRAPANAGSVLTGVVALTTFSVEVNLAKLFLVRSAV